MAKSRVSKNKNIPGIMIECKSGRYLAFYDHRTDIVANGSSEKEAKNNLKEMYADVMQYEDQEEDKPIVELPPEFKTKKFKVKTPA